MYDILLKNIYVCGREVKLSIIYFCPFGVAISWYLQIRQLVANTYVAL